VPLRQLEALELGELLGSLLTAVVQAQEQAVRATVAFVDEVGFEPITGGGERMRTVKLRYTKKDENNVPAEFEAEVPLLALVNVPSLAVKEAKLSLSYDVMTTESTTTDGAAEGPATLGGRVKETGIQPARLTGLPRKRTAETNGVERSTTSIDVEITLEQQAIAIGLERLFDLAELGITERSAEGGPP
jgi:Protein of unknown function (DUF2589)